MPDSSTQEQGYPLLDQIETPSDLRRLKAEQLPALCAEIRHFMLSTLSSIPGHLGANLGAVEITVAMHYVFDTPHDRIVWDVGHQAYVHKILTGRRRDFHTLRTWGGLAGFPIPSESEYDTFAAGHASNSISAALGMAVGTALKEEDRRVVAFIGDGAMSGGMAFEGLNNASSFPNNLLIILNDNNMSIDKNVGGLNRHMVNLLTNPTYNSMRYDMYRMLRKLHIVHEDQHKDLQRFNNRIKALLSGQTNFFDSFSIRYLGPTDGHDVVHLVQLLQDIRDMKGPRLLHISTTKGKGYIPAEKEPTIWHAPGKFDPTTGERIQSVSSTPQPPKYQDVFGKTLVELADRDERIVSVTPAMPTGCSMTFMMEKYPKRSFDVGIAEEHAVTFSSGLAAEGFIPVCNIYSTFMQRAYDQLIHDVALTESHVVFCLDRAGLVGEDGATHQGAFDIAYLRTIPSMTVCSPYDEVQLRHLMYSAAFDWVGPVAIRYPRGTGSVVEWQQPMQSYPHGRARVLSEGSSLAILSLGPIGVSASHVVERLQAEGYSVAHIDLVFAKPLDEACLRAVFASTQKILTIEEGCLNGGVGSAILQLAMQEDYAGRIKTLGLPDEFIPHGTPQEQKLYCGLDEESIYQAAKHLLAH
ncbi:MAG: 1-deoxy-D-xylulose-5-phosphate synthase [Porphyromonas sp.]